MNQFDRRTFIRRAGLAGFSAVAAAAVPNFASADPDPPAGSTKSTNAAPEAFAEPTIYPLQLAGADAFVVQDGTFIFPGIQPSFVPEAKPEELGEILKRNFLPADHLALSLNVLVIKGKSGVMIFDAGAASFAPTTGKLIRGLARIGISPGDVEAVYVTHAHSDHIAGLVLEGGKMAFPNARIFADKTEMDFWTSDSPDLSGMRTTLETRNQSVAAIKKTIGQLKSQLALKEPGKLTSEVEMIAAPGHTPGHSLFLVTLGGEKLLVIGDAVHAYALQFPHPEWTMAYDVDPAQAVRTRNRIFKNAAADQTLVSAYHLPFPGVGHIRTAAQGYEWVPRPWAV